ncbi:hypothetical protein [Pedobacter jamesrossensis]|uniref:Uncharacterized protein n=1 Tax=Pedobacter jamesrossensis TaxID=1908238 RepID=A0ABV8NPQ9_9SPHI
MNKEKKTEEEKKNPDQPAYAKEEIPFADGEGTKLDQESDKSKSKENESKNEG